MAEDIEGEDLLKGLELPPATGILAKLWAIQKVVMGLQKNKKSNNYDYTTGDKILSVVKPLMNHYGVLLEPNITKINNTKIDYVTGAGTNYQKAKTEMFTELEFLMVWVCVHTGEERAVKWGANGMNDWEKGFGSALTYGERYFFLKYFHIQTDKDDIDNPDRKPDVLPTTQQQGQGTAKVTAPAPTAKNTVEKPPVDKSTPPAPIEKKAPAAKAPATPPAEKAQEQKADPKPKTEKAPAPVKEEAKAEPAKTAVDPAEAKRKDAAKAAFAKEDSAGVMRFLVTEKKVNFQTANEWIDATAIELVLRTYNEYKASLKKA